MNDDDRTGYTAAHNGPTDHRGDIPSAERMARLNYRWQATKLINHCEDAKWPAVPQLIVDVIPDPRLAGALRLRHRTAMLTSLLARTRTHTQLKARFDRAAVNRTFGKSQHQSIKTAASRRLPIYMT